MKLGVIAIAMTIGVVACGSKDPKAGSSTSSGSADVGSPTGELACAQDSDCVFVQTGCCGCNAGGGNEVLNTAAAARRKPPSAAACKDTMCSQVIMETPECTGRPVCVAGMCGALRQ